MAEEWSDPAARSADEFARAVAGDDGEVYVRLFTAAYNIASDASGRSGSAPREVASAVLQASSRLSTPRTRVLHMAREEGVGDGPGGSVLDDPVFIENCQYVIPDDTRILGGEPTPEFPDCVAVGKPDQWCCSGTLIAPDVVVTAAHCDAGGCNARVFIGPDVTRPRDGRVIGVREVMTHELYPAAKPFDDLTVLLLADRVDDVPPRRIASPQAIASAISVRLVGYGTTEPGGLAGYGQRRFVDVPLASPDAAYGARPETEFVAGRPFLERDSCPGDSGGPAYVDEGGEWVLAGATSRGTLGSVRECGDGGIYTHVPIYEDWINRVTA